MPQSFGGAWTEEKLQALEDYLNAYLNIFTSHTVASRFTRHYVDAFAGSGLREVRPAADKQTRLDFEEADQYLRGSVHRVLGLRESFHRYHFVERDKTNADELRHSIATEFPERARSCVVVETDANAYLVEWAAKLTWTDRAVVFLDPFGMAVRWDTIKALAQTKKVDLWLLFPSSSVIRMLPKRGPTDEAWSRKLTDFFGTDSWNDHFFPASPQGDLFGAESRKRDVSQRTVAEYILQRLGEVFHGVVDEPLVLYNSRNSPLFMLLFAAANPKGAPTGVRIARHIIQRK
ncbi:MAG: three-Cys-motif partner protein TcmP [Aquisalimonadaceae bacterium]